MSATKKRRRNKRRGRWVFAAAFLLAVLAFFVFDSSYRIVTEELSVPVSGLPEGFEGFKIAHLSDLHGGVWRDEGGKALLKAVRAAAPDIIVITGDLINGSADELEPLRPLLSGLAATAPAYFVSGNHDWASGAIGELYSLLEETGVTALRGEYTLLERGGDSVALAGCEDPNGYPVIATPGELTARVRAELGDKCVILLYHRNTALEELARAGVGLALCGHGHGGVIRVPGVGPLLGTEHNLFPKTADGVYFSGATAMFVSRGLGLLNGLPRLFNNPQLAVLTLRPAG